MVRKRRSANLSPPCRSGWCTLANVRKAILIAAPSASRDTPSTLYKFTINCLPNHEHLPADKCAAEISRRDPGDQSRSCLWKARPARLVGIFVLKIALIFQPSTTAPGHVRPIASAPSAPATLATAVVAGMTQDLPQILEPRSRRPANSCRRGAASAGVPRANNQGT